MITKTCVDIIRCIYNPVFSAGALKALVLWTPASRTPALKTSSCTVGYINTLEWFCICNKTRDAYPLLRIYIDLCYMAKSLEHDKIN